MFVFCILTSQASWVRMLDFVSKYLQDTQKGNSYCSLRMTFSSLKCPHLARPMNGMPALPFVCDLEPNLVTCRTPELERTLTQIPFLYRS